MTRESDVGLYGAATKNKKLADMKNVKALYAKRNLR